MLEYFWQHPWLQATVWICGLLAGALLVFLIVRKVLLNLSGRVLSFLHVRDRHVMLSVVRHLTRIAPVLVILVGIDTVPHLHVTAIAVIKNVANAFLVLVIALSISALLDVADVLYEQRTRDKQKPIKGLIQVVKIVMFGVCIILMLAALVDRSPLILLSGLGAMAAVLMLVFQDTLLSFVAGIQILSTDTVRLGDWVEMPSMRADGSVIEIALHTVKVQNWDNTITTVPIRKLVSDPFINWRGMSESGGRRIKRSLFLDQTSIGFLDRETFQRLSTYNLLEEYLADKAQEITEWNSKVRKHADVAANQRHLTNVGTFRAYTLAYLRANSRIHQQMTLLVRQMAPGPQGLPLEIYCFTNTTAWGEYEEIQSDLFDHLYSILPEFGLRVFQEPSGADLARGLENARGGASA